ncbi:hypothetical protein [Streptomyces cadmiisoli]|uniref:hypothetical protein n=1 Tax=Streptomyces cadmiisoli TaxID=2184053 RepID=UPI003668C16A
MAHARALRVGGALAACGVLALGCTGGGGGGEGASAPSTPKASRSGSADVGSAGETGTPSPSGPAVDPDRQPGSAAQARALIRKVIADPELFGPDVVPASPYESDPSRWAVLGENCAWQLRKLPKDVLATLTRHFDVPTGGGKGSMRLSATVTVHRTATDAAWEQATMLEEALGCEEQLLRPGERLIGLTSSAFGRGEGGNVDTEDSLLESGRCSSDARGGPYPYLWQQVTLGSVVAAVSACGGPGRSADEVQRLVQEPLARVMVHVQREIGPDAAAATGTPEPKSSHGASASGTNGGA